MNMHPDTQLEHDTIIITLGFIAFALIAFLITFEHGGLDPIDRCANVTIDTLSPYQIQQLTGSPMPTQYDHVRHWCNDTIDYRHRVNTAKSYPLYPLNDMMIN
tara:strand:+ start:149 stop:457 length:309 start_codon:yes stop_codon:yes gene_type:complete